VVATLVDFVRQHGNGGNNGNGSSGGGGGTSGAGSGNRKSTTQDSGGGGSGGNLNSSMTTGKYKVSMCRDLALRGICPRSSNCTFAHSDTELDK